MEPPNIVISRASGNNNSPLTQAKFNTSDIREGFLLTSSKTNKKGFRHHSEDKITFGTIEYMDSNANEINTTNSPATLGEEMVVEKLPRPLSRCSLSSIELTSDLSDVEESEDNSNGDESTNNKTSMWVKLRKAVRWAPFMQSYKKNYRWIQLAGHSGGFKPGENGTIMKKSCKREVESLQKLMKDPLKHYVPEYKKQVIENEELYIEMQDLLAEFDHPAFVMDCKIGVRTYLEDEVKKNPAPREDLYLKMVSVDPNAPTDEEKANCSCTKERYMQFREQLSSTASLGFRIEGIKRGENNPDKDFKKLKSEDDISSVIRRFTENKKDIQVKYLQRLKEIKQALSDSNFFSSHELIGSSLLFVHDTKGKVGVWLIDFGKTVPLINGTSIDHKSQWSLGNHEDGYLIGLENIIKIFGEIDPCKS